MTKTLNRRAGVNVSGGAWLDCGVCVACCCSAIGGDVLLLGLHPVINDRTIAIMIKALTYFILNLDSCFHQSLVSLQLPKRNIRFLSTEILRLYKNNLKCATSARSMCIGLPGVFIAAAVYARYALSPRILRVRNSLHHKKARILVHILCLNR